MKKLIREEEIREAAKTHSSVAADENTVITPSARDMAKQLGVQIIKGGGNDEQIIRNPNLEQNWPFKKIAIASDHGGFDMKEELKNFLRKKDFKVIDLGPANENACDYPDYAFKAAQMVATKNADCGIVIDSVGIGSAMAANKVPGILAAKCNNVTEAKSAREHNYANVLTLGSKIIGITAAEDIVLNFLQTKGGAERHLNRVNKIINYENKGK